MSITNRQFEILTEMGINLWQSKVSIAENEITAQLPIDYPKIKSTQFFQDILTTLDLSIGEVKAHANFLDLGFINWHLNADKISLAHNILSTPSIDVLSQSTSLKRQLWQTLTEIQL